MKHPLPRPVSLSRAIGLLALVLALLTPAFAVTVTESGSAPAGPSFLSQPIFNGGVDGAHDYSDNGGPPGQSFTMGAASYLLNSVTVKGAGSMGGNYNYWVLAIHSVTDIGNNGVNDGDTLTQVSWEVSQFFNPSSSTSYLTFTLNTPVLLNANSIYEFDIYTTENSNGIQPGNLGSGGYYAFADSSSDVYAGGVALQNGFTKRTSPNPGTVTQTMTGVDRTFFLAGTETGLTWDTNTSTGGTIENGSGTWVNSGSNWNNGSGNVPWNNASPTLAKFGGTSTTGSAGTVTVSGTVAVTGLSFGQVTGTYAVTSGTVALSGASATITVDDDAAIIGSVLSGSAAVTKAGTGNLILAGANTYTGTTTINSGTLQLGDGATNGSVVGNIANNAALVYNTVGSGTYAGVISGNGTVAKTGAGTQTLTGAHTYTGATTISQGTLRLGDGTTDGSISNSSNIANNGALVYNTVGSKTYSGNISGNGTVTKTGAGTQTLSGSNSFSGGSSIQQGTVVATSDNALGTGQIGLDGGTLKLQGAVGAIGINFTGLNNVSVSGSSAVGVLPIVGDNWNNFAGTSLGAQNGALKDSNGNTNVATLVSYTSPGQYTTNSGNALLNGYLDNSTGAQNVVVSALPYESYNVYAYFGSDQANRSGSVAIGSGTYFYTTRGNVSDYVLATATTSGAAVQSNYAVFSGLTGATFTLNQYRGDNNSGLHGLEVSGSTTITMTNALALNANSTIEVSGNSFASISGKFSSNSNQLNVTGSSTGANAAYTLSLGSVGGVALANSSTINIANNGTGVGTVNFGALTDSGTAAALTKSGAGILNLNSAAASIVAGTQFTVASGTVNANHATALGTLAAVTVNSGAVLASGTTQTYGSLAGGGLVTPGANTLLTIGGNNQSATFGGVIAGSGVGLTKVGTGTQSLSGTSTYTGATNVTAGTLLITDTGRLSPSTTVTVGANGNFVYNNSTTPYAANINVTGTLGGHGKFSGTIGGTGQVGPGNSPGILTAAATDPGAGLGYAFEFTGTGSPDYTNAAASGNDVFRLTSGTPFSSSLDSDNLVKIYLNVGSLNSGDVFRGGFYTDTPADFLATIQNANYAFYLFNAGGSTTYNGVNYNLYSGFLTFELATVQENAAFAGGGASGYIMQFSVIPEPSTMVLMGLGLAAVFSRRRKVNR